MRPKPRQRDGALRPAWRRMRHRLDERIRRWALRRHGPDGAETTIASQRIYVLPTPAGLVFALMLATMLAGSMNYNNNMGFALTFLLAGTGIAAIYQTHRNLLGLRLRMLGADPVFAGEPLAVRFSLANDGARVREELTLDWGADPRACVIVEGRSRETVVVALETTRRGLLRLPPLRISTLTPLGLVRAWSWIQMDVGLLVYPRPAEQASAPPADGDAVEAGQARTGEEEFAGLRPWRGGDSPRRVAWRHYARTGDLFVREYRGGGADQCLWIDWSRTDAPDDETRIARLARLALEADRSGSAWGLALPARRTGPAHGREHLHECLRQLAVHGPAESAP